MKVFFIS